MLTRATSGRKLPLSEIVFRLRPSVSAVRGLTGCSCEVSPARFADGGPLSPLPPLRPIPGGAAGSGGGTGGNPPPPGGGPGGGGPGGGGPGGGGPGGGGPGGGGGGPPPPGAAPAPPPGPPAGPAPRPVLRADPDPLTRDFRAVRDTVRHLNWNMSNKMAR